MPDEEEDEASGSHGAGALDGDGGHEDEGDDATLSCVVLVDAGHEDDAVHTHIAYGEVVEALEVDEQVGARAKLEVEAETEEETDAALKDEAKAEATREAEATRGRTSTPRDHGRQSDPDDHGGDYDDQIPTGRAAAVAGDGPLSDLLWGEPDAEVSVQAPLPPPAPPPTQPPAQLPATAPDASAPAPAKQVDKEPVAEVRANLEIEAKAEEKAEAAAEMNDIIETDARRNDAEGYVFNMRDKIAEGGEYGEFISAADREKFTSDLTAAEDWLYDDVNGTKAQYVEKYAELKATGDAVAWRFKEAGMRGEWITAVAGTINKYREAATNPGDKYGHITEAKLGSIVNECNEVENG